MGGHCLHAAFAGCSCSVSTWKPLLDHAGRKPWWAPHYSCFLPRLVQLQSDFSHRDSNLPFSQLSLCPVSAPQSAGLKNPISKEGTIGPMSFKQRGLLTLSYSHPELVQVIFYPHPSKAGIIKCPIKFPLFSTHLHSLNILSAAGTRQAHVTRTQVQSPPEEGRPPQKLAMCMDSPGALRNCCDVMLWGLSQWTICEFAAWHTHSALQPASSVSVSVSWGELYSSWNHFPLG